MIKIFCSSNWLKEDVVDNICKNLKNKVIYVQNPGDSDIIFFSNFDGNRFDNFKCPKILFNFEPSFYYHNCDLYFTFQDTNDKNYCFPYFLSWQNLIINKKPIDYLTNNLRKDCCYMYSNKVEHRHKLFNKIKNILSIDCLGSDQPNNQLINITTKDRHDDGWVQRAIEKYKNYKYVIACENSFGKNYITEKIILPFLAGTIPIYCGPKDVFKWFNKNSFIYIPPEEIDNADEIITNSLNNYENMQSEFIFKNGKLEKEYTYDYYSQLILNKLYHKKIAILCMSCYKNENHFQNLEWVRKFEIIKKNFPNILIYRVLGNNKNNISIKENIPILNVDCPDNYEYLITKVFKSIKNISEIHKDLDYIIKVDDDVEFNIIKLANLLNKNNIEYGGYYNYNNFNHKGDCHIGKCENSEFNKEIDLPSYEAFTGPIYVLGKKSINIINNNKIPTPEIDIMYEDIYMGLLLIKQNNIEKTILNNIYSNSLNEYLNNENIISWHNYNKSFYTELNQINL